MKRAQELAVALKTPAVLSTVERTDSQSYVLAMFAFPKMPTALHSSMNCFARAELSIVALLQYAEKSAILANVLKHDKTMSL